MKDGLYIARFRTPLDEASGVIVIQGTNVLGGDGGLYYTGAFTERDKRLEVKITARQYNEAAQSVFGLFETLNLTLTGKAKGNGYEFEGRADAAPSMRFTATLEPAAL